MRHLFGKNSVFGPCKGPPKSKNEYLAKIQNGRQQLCLCANFFGQKIKVARYGKTLVYKIWSHFDQKWPSCGHFSFLPFPKNQNFAFFTAQNNFFQIGPRSPILKNLDYFLPNSNKYYDYIIYQRYPQGTWDTQRK